MGLRPVLVNPRTLVRTWGTRTEWVWGEEGMTTPPFHPAVGRHSRHPWSPPAAAMYEIRVGSGRQ